jgi:hypothetical protein
LPKEEDEEDDPDAEKKEEDLGPVDLETIKAMPRKGAKKQTSAYDEEFDEIKQIELQYEKD